MISLMRLRNFPHFLTLVVVFFAFTGIGSLLLANPVGEVDPNPLPVLNKGGENKDDVPISSEVQLPTLQITPSGRKVPVPTDEIHFDPAKLPSWGSTDFGLGAISGIYDKKSENATYPADEILALLQIQRTKYNFNNTGEEYGFSLTRNRLFGLNWGYKWIPKRFWGQPFFKLGGWAMYDSKDGMGNFLDYKRYFLVSAIGFENLFRSRRSWKAEFGAATGSLGTFCFGQLIYAIPD